jgi:hypothetical protein
MKDIKKDILEIYYKEGINDAECLSLVEAYIKGLLDDQKNLCASAFIEFIPQRELDLQKAILENDELLPFECEEWEKSDKDCMEYIQKTPYPCNF